MDINGRRRAHPFYLALVHHAYTKKPEALASIQVTGCAFREDEHTEGIGEFQITGYLNTYTFTVFQEDPGKPEGTFNGRSLDVLDTHLLS